MTKLVFRMWGKPLRHCLMGVIIWVNDGGSVKKYLAVVVALLTHSAMAEAESWYYCDSVHAYFPYVQHCPESWREVDPNSMPHNASEQPDEDNPSAKPQNSSTIKAEPPKVPILSNGVGAVKKHQDEAFQEGRVDRQHWEIWIKA